MKTILFTNTYSGIPLEIIKTEIPQGFEISFLSEQTEDALINQVKEADYILAGGRIKIGRNVLVRAARLKMIQRSGVGLDSLDLDAMKEQGIPLYVNQGVNAESVAEHTLLLMLACLRRLTLIDRNTKAGIWKKQDQGVQTRELRGKTVGIVGMGNVAQNVVALLKPFGVKILYNNLFQMDLQYEKENNMKFASIDEVLEDSDIITLHCALTEETKHLIDEKAIGKMRTGAILVNTARGGIIKTDSLAEALKSGHISFAALDVHEEEPIKENYLLKGIDNVILTPHIAGVTYDSFRQMMHDAFRNIECFEKGEFDSIAQSRFL